MKSVLAFTAMATMFALVGCASQPLTQDQLSQVSPFDMCVAGEIYLLTGSVTINGRPVVGETLANEGLRRGITCEPRAYYERVAEYRLQQEQQASQNAAANQQAFIAGLQGAAEQIQQQKLAQQQIDAQRQAAYYQQLQATNAANAPVTTTCRDIYGNWTCNTTH